MKVRFVYLVCLIFALMFLLPINHFVLAETIQVSHPTAQLDLPRVSSQDNEEDKLVIGGSFTLRQGERINGRLIILGGRAEVASNAVVGGDAVILGGSLVVNGVIEGDVLVLGGLAEFGPTAVIGGDLSSVSGTLHLDPMAKVEGTVHENLELPFDLPGRVETPSTSQLAERNVGFTFWGSLFFVFRSFLWASLAILVVLFLPRNTRRVGDVIVSNPVISGGLGLMTGLVGMLIILVLAVTIIGIPVSLIVAVGLVAAWALGMVVIGVETGERFANLLKQEWALPVNAGIGTFLVTLVVYGVEELVPCIGWLLPLIVGSIGLGGVLLTVFGTRDYPAEPGRQV